jgi:nucleotide-binding universal stress UspA family protein
VLLQALLQADVDSVIVGTRGRGAIARALFGSVADAVVRGATKPVLVARGASVRSIVVAFDGSTVSRRAARAAATLSLRTGSAITLLHVADVPPARAERASAVAALRSAVQPLLTEARSEIRSLAPEAPVADRFVEGDPAAGILDEVQKIAADLIVLGRAGWTHDKRLPVGSVAMRVVTHSDASVLVVP